MYSGIDTIWVLLGAALVFFMQAGFAMVETGFTRAKNAGNIIMKNLMDFAIGAPLYWIIGFGLMFGGSGALIGGLDLFSAGNYASILPEGIPKEAFLIFQTVFCATAATIVSGAMAERTKFSAYCIYSAVISLLIYPIAGHWVWGGGWLADMGFHDFAGSTAVHMLGGICALIGAAIIGPRIGKYDAKGNPRAIPGHSLTLGALGVFILWFCWFGFNGCSTVSMTGNDTIVLASKVFVNTNLAAAVATVVTMILTWVKYSKPDVSMTLNGSLAGLVAITAGCDTVAPWAAAVIGIVAGIAIVYAVEFIEKRLKVDDPVGAVGVHCICGALGTLMVGLFSDGTATDGFGLLLGGGWHVMGVQTLGVAAVAAWTAVGASVLFLLIKQFHGLRVEPAVEIAGLDAAEHGLASSYADFMPVPEADSLPAVSVSAKAEKADDIGKAKFTKVSIVCRQAQLETLKNALASIGVTGITVTQVMGCGTQNGQPELYRGAPVGMTLLPKMKVEVVISKVPVRIVIETAKAALRTGHIGDGKLFIYDVENVVRVRTGEEGYDALQDD